jgi:hypothetical protein
MSIPPPTAIAKALLDGDPENEHALAVGWQIVLKAFPYTLECAPPKST